MKTYSRRKFLKNLGAASALFLAGRTAAQIPVFGSGDAAKPFEVLVLGDSIASGHGLKEDQKFYTLTRNWLQDEIFQNKRDVNLKVKAHSGTTLALHPEVAKALEAAEVDEAEALHPEINVDYPTAEKQIDIAAREYAAEEKQADLVMITCGINDITTTVILDPFGDDDQLRRDIAKYCRDSMIDLLRQAGGAFPNARIALIGYFPLVSPKTYSGRFFNALLEVYNLPRPLKPLANNPLTKQFFKIFHKKSARRSRIWVEESNRRFREAVAEFNSGFERPRAVFVESPITEENCFGTKNPLVFGMGKKGRTEDLTYDERSVECRTVAPTLKKIRGLKYSVPFCQISGLAHPNVEGSRAYAEAIKTAVRPRLEYETAVPKFVLHL
jgi:lysophospholipase L1-like esterase